MANLIHQRRIAEAIGASFADTDLVALEQIGERVTHHRSWRTLWRRRTTTEPVYRERHVQICLTTSDPGELLVGIEVLPDVGSAHAEP